MNFRVGGWGRDAALIPTIETGGIAEKFYSMQR